MNKFQANIIINDPAQVILRNVPFKKGERVRVVVESEKEIEEKRLREKQRAFEIFQRMSRRMEKNSQFQSLTEEEIAEEIAAYRRGE